MESVSAFIVGTCQIRPKVHHDVFDSMQFTCQYRPNVHDDVFLKSKQFGTFATVKEFMYDLQCGSSAEFYIEPINPCIDDMDVLCFAHNTLSFTEDIPVLPDDFLGLLDTIVCLQIVPYPDYPGFIQHRDFGEMRYNWHCRKFQFQKTNILRYRRRESNLVKQLNLDDSPTEETETVGPAARRISDRTDFVPCTWCPQWPKEAKQWPFRRRKYGWPTTADIHKIVESGCHVVFAKHPECRNDVHQCRLSFSGAELCLLQSWTPVQQIVYHMLRFFAKRELIQKNRPKEEEVLSTYHLKTLMLWSCEEMPPERWTKSSVVEMCCILLRKLSEWLKKRYCPNYFIPQANLLHDCMNQKVANETIRRLNEFSRFNILNSWFAVNYIRPVLKREFNFEDNRKTVIDFVPWMLCICEINDAKKLNNFDWEFSSGFWSCARRIFCKNTVKTSYNFRSSMKSFCCWKNSVWKRTDQCSFLSSIEFLSSFPSFFKVLFILHAAIALEFKKNAYDSEIFIEFIREVSWQPKVVRSKYHNFPIPSKTRLDESVVLFLKAQDLMENLTGLNSPQEFKLVSQLSKELLRISIKCDDFMSSAFRDMALVYLAALHFSESDYETAIDFCSTVFMNQQPHNAGERKEKEDDTKSLNAGCLFYIDDVVRIIGFNLLFRRIQDNLQYSRRRYLLDLRLTPEVFAQYLTISSIERRHRLSGVSYHFQAPRFPLDEILKTLTKSKKMDSVLRVYQRTDQINKLDEHRESSLPHEVEIIKLLMEYSLLCMKTFYNATCKDFGIHCSTVDCYRAAYLYKCRKYPEVLLLSEIILDRPDLQGNLVERAFANIMVWPPLESYFDSSIQCLLGFRTLVWSLSPLNEDMRKTQFDRKSTSYNFLGSEVFLLTDALCRTFDVRCHYFIRRHFLARYLKVRCLIDCNHSISEVMFEFKKLKSNLPFEHLMRSFLRQKLR